MTERKRRRSSPGKQQPRCLRVQELEKRELFAGLSFSSGVLRVEMAQVPGNNAFVREAGGMLHFNGSVARNVAGVPGGQLRTDLIRHIVVNGTNQSEVIDLSGTQANRAAFRSLNGSTIYGMGGNDTIKGTYAADRIYGGTGNDRIHGLGGVDRIWGEAGNDTIYGDGNSGAADAFSASNYIWGGPGNDVLFGGAANDWLYGEDGNDRLWGRGGNDQMWGGRGEDYFSGDAGYDIAFVDQEDFRRRTVPFAVEVQRRG